MHSLRRMIIGFATALLLFWLFMAAVTASVALTIHSPAKIKSWVAQSGVYDNVIDVLLARGQESAEHHADDIPLNDPGVQAAAKKTFTPQVLQKNTENVIDGTYRWLERKTAQPDFRVNVGELKQQFANNIGDYLHTRIEALPACAAGQVPTSDSLFTINCRPPGVNIDSEIQNDVNKLVTSKDFLSEPVITANSFKTSEGQPVFYNPAQEGSSGESDKAPKLYKSAGQAPWLFGILALIGGAVIILVSQERRKGIKRVGIVFIIIGALLVVIYALITLLTHRLEAAVHLDATAAALRPSAVYFIRTISGSVANAYMWFSLAYLLLGTAMLLAVKFWLSPDQEVAVEPVIADETTHKPTDKLAQKRSVSKKKSA